jgi:hypothetical protein
MAHTDNQLHACIAPHMLLLALRPSQPLPAQPQWEDHGGYEPQLWAGKHTDTLCVTGSA